MLISATLRLIQLFSSDDSEDLGYIRAHIDWQNIPGEVSVSIE